MRRSAGPRRALLVPRTARPGFSRVVFGPGVGLRAGLLSALVAGVVAASLLGCGRGPEDDRPAAGRSLPEGTRSTLRHHREVVVRQGIAIPRFLGGRDPGLCLEVAKGVDASQWRASLVFDGAPAGSAIDEPPPKPRPPVAVSDRVLCFERGWPASADGPIDLQLCGSVIDLYDGTAFDLPCRPLRFEPDSGARAELMGRVGTAVRDRHTGRFPDFLDRLAALAEQARAGDFPALGTRIDLIAVHYAQQEGGDAEVQRAERLLRSLPDWIDDPAATALAADAVYLRGLLHLRRLDDLEGAWRSFLDAHALYQRVLDKKRLAAVRGQGEVLARVGAVRDGLRRLDAALADCAPTTRAPTTRAPTTRDPTTPDATAPDTSSSKAPCSETQWISALGLRSWLTLLDSDATPGELAAAEEDLRAILSETSPEPAERANHLVNRALLRARRGLEPSEPLVEARRLVDDAGDTRRAELLAGWGRMAQALYELSRTSGNLERAHRQCRALSLQETTPRLTAWAFSCLGRIRHRQGELRAADAAFRRALALHEHATPERLGRLMPLGPGQRADDYYRAARLALDRHEEERAWGVLTTLDRLPADGSREDPSRSQPGARRHGDSGYRAFAVEDEVLLLHRDPHGEVREVRRTPLLVGDLRRRTDAVTRALDERRLSDAEWSELVRPLAAALWPEMRPEAGLPEREVATYALHGLLQRVPLAALPDPQGDERRWLADRVLPVIRPAGFSSAPEAAAGERAPLVILDPTENLGSRRELAELYSAHFPQGRLLVGSEATVAAFRRALPTASWLHADTHGSYDPAFPERSSLELADGAVTLRELAGLPLSLSFANLSGCRTGTWPATADSGRYGLGGLLARRGADWVIASRADLLNRLALAFNPAFYRALTAGASIPDAYDRALATVRQEQPAVAWAALFLLRGGERSGNPTAAPRATPTPADSFLHDEALEPSAGEGDAGAKDSTDLPAPAWR